MYSQQQPNNFNPNPNANLGPRFYVGTVNSQNQNINGSIPPINNSNPNNNLNYNYQSNAVMSNNSNYGQHHNNFNNSNQNNLGPYTETNNNNFDPRIYAPPNQFANNSNMYTGNTHNPGAYVNSNTVEVRTNFNNFNNNFAQGTQAGYVTPYETPQPQLQEKEKPKYIIHKVDYNDTLDGLALQYNVSARDIRTFNELTTNDIYYLKELKIPNADMQNLHMPDVEYDAEELRKKQKMHTLQEIMSAEDKKAAQYYLDENNWDINAAIDNYKQDVEFEKRYKAHTEQAKNQKHLLKKIQ